MKKSHKKLLIFESIFIILFILSNFVPSILGEYYKPILLLVLLILFKFLFGFEKDNHRDAKNICIEIVIFLLVYFMFYYLFGIIISYAKTLNYLNYDGIMYTIIPNIITVILMEVLRYMILQKSEGANLLFIFSCIFFVFFDLINSISSDIFTSPYNLFMFVAITLLPTLSKNIFLCYISYKTGFKPPILYMLIISLYKYFIPIVPNPNEYLYSIIELVVPMIYLYKIYNYFKRERDEKISNEYNKKRISNLLFPLLLIIFLVYITSGYFYYHAIVIASGSMTPNILKGDVVVIKKVSNKKNIELGTVIAYNYNQRIIVHRVVKKVNLENELFYYTKGDANNDIDNYKITDDMIIGIVNFRVPYIGYPTIWLNKV